MADFQILNANQVTMSALHLGPNIVSGIFGHRDHDSHWAAIRPQNRAKESVIVYCQSTVHAHPQPTGVVFQQRRNIPPGHTVARGS